MMRWILALVILLFGIITIDLESIKWIALGLTLFSVPLLFQFIKFFDLHIWTLWIGIFLVLQSFLSPILINHDYITLTPNLNLVLDVKAGVAGVSGKQKITTDAKGFRTTKDIDYQSNKPFRIFAIGASTTEQIYIDDHDTWTHLLQEHLTNASNQDIEVINTGASGLRAKQHLATLQKIIDLHPDLVIFLLGINDWNRHIKDSLPEVTIPDEESKDESYRSELSLKNTLVGKFMAVALSTMTASNKPQKDPTMVEDHGEFHTKKANSLARASVLQLQLQDVSEDYKEQLTKISATCQENGIKCVFITQPHGYQVGATEEFKKGFWMTPPYQPYTLDFDSMSSVANLYNTYLINFSKQNNHKVCDPASALKPTNENFYDDCHFNTSGARNMSVVVGNCLEDSLDN